MAAAAAAATGDAGDVISGCVLSFSVCWPHQRVVRVKTDSRFVGRSSCRCQRSYKTGLGCVVLSEAAA